MLAANIGQLKEERIMVEKGLAADIGQAARPPTCRTSVRRCGSATTTALSR